MNSPDFGVVVELLHSSASRYGCMKIKTDCENTENGKENIAGKFVSAETDYGGMATK